MIFADIPDGSSVFLDANTFVYHFAADRLMTLEAINVFGWPIAGIAARLRRHPGELQKLTLYRTAVQILLASNVTILTIAPQLVETATSVSQQWGLLSSDALIVGVMQAHGLTNLASNDSDFDRVTGLVRFSPQ